MRLNLKYASLKNAYDLLSMLWLRVAHLVCIVSILMFIPTLLNAIHVGDAFFSNPENMLAPDLCEIDSFELVACFLALTCSVC